MRLIINDFDKLLKEEEQIEIQDFLSGYNLPYYFEYPNECDICNFKSYNDCDFYKHDTKESGFINICYKCLKKNNKKKDFEKLIKNKNDTNTKR